MSVFGNINITMDEGWGIATGELNDGNALAGRSVGYCTAVTAGTPTAVFGTTYTQQSSAAQRSLKSSSANDTAAGTGAQTVTVNYLDSTMTNQSEVVTLNGTTAVNMVSTTVQFIESIVVTSTGSGRVNAGTISIFTTTGGGGSAFASINTGDNSTFYAHHYVPAGVSCYIIKHTGSGTLAVGTTFMTIAGDPRATTTPIVQTGDVIVHLAGGTEDHIYEVPLVIPGPNLISMLETPVTSVASNKCFASFDWVQD